MKKACLIVNYNLYESKRHFTVKLAEAMERQGIETRVIDMQEQAIEADTGEKIREFGPDFTCSFNHILPLSNGKFFWDVLQIPHISFLVDPPLYSISLLNSPYSIITCVDKFDCDSVRSYNFQNVFFLPHAIEKEIEPGNEKREYDVVFLGSCYDYESLRAEWQKEFPPKLNQMLDEAIDLVLSDRYIPLIQALITSWNALGLPPENIDFAKLFYYLDNYTRGKDRVELIKAIKDVPVHVFGEMMPTDPVFKKGWQHYLKNQPNVVFHPSVPYDQAIDALKRSKVCLNSMPFFKNGTHERVFMSLAAGAVPVTTDNLFWKEEFKVGEELRVYHSSKWEEANEQVHLLLSDETKRQQIAAAGRKRVMEKHTWDNRVNEIREAVKKLGF